MEESTPKTDVLLTQQLLRQTVFLDRVYHPSSQYYYVNKKATEELSVQFPRGSKHGSNMAYESSGVSSEIIPSSVEETVISMDTNEIVYEVRHRVTRVGDTIAGLLFSASSHINFIEEITLHCCSACFSSCSNDDNGTVAPKCVMTQHAGVKIRAPFMQSIIELERCEDDDPILTKLNGVMGYSTTGQQRCHVPPQYLYVLVPWDCCWIPTGAFVRYITVRIRQPIRHHQWVTQLGSQTCPPDQHITADSILLEDKISFELIYGYRRCHLDQKHFVLSSMRDIGMGELSDIPRDVMPTDVHTIFSMNGGSHTTASWYCVQYDGKIRVEQTVPSLSFLCWKHLASASRQHQLQQWGPYMTLPSLTPPDYLSRVDNGRLYTIPRFQLFPAFRRNVQVVLFSDGKTHQVEEQEEQLNNGPMYLLDSGKLNDVQVEICTDTDASLSFHLWMDMNEL